MSDIFAAVATAGMDLNKTNSAKCEPERPIPVIMFRGTGDPVCHYQGGDSGYNDGLNFLGAEGSFRFWAEKDGCTGEPTTNSDGCEEYSNCKDGTKVVLCINKGTPNKEGETNGHSQGDATIGWPFLKQFTLPTEYTTLNNKGVPAKITLNLDNNQLTEINGLDKVPEKSLITVSNNKFTLATLPEQTANIKTYTYAPQAAYEVAESLSELDLTSQPTATTTFSFVAADGTALVEGTDYTVTEPGKFTFIKEQAQKVHGVMESSVFTAFTGAKAFVTTEFTVTASTGIQTVSAAAAGKLYNLQGVEVQKPVKGLYIQNGKKMLVK
jgi:hypothetical protein